MSPSLVYVFGMVGLACMVFGGNARTVGFFLTSAMIATFLLGGGPHFDEEEPIMKYWGIWGAEESS